MTIKGTNPPAGWYTNPQGEGQRWWDGNGWTEHVQLSESKVPVVPERGAGTDVLDRVVGILARQPQAFWLVALGLVIIIVGSFGPWARAFILTVNGTEGDGIGFIIGAAGAFASLWVYASTGRRGALVGPILVGLIVAADSGRILHELQSASQTELFGEQIEIAQVQWGIYATLIGGGAVALFCLHLITRTVVQAKGRPESPEGRSRPRRWWW